MSSVTLVPSDHNYIIKNRSRIIVTGIAKYRSMTFCFKDCSFSNFSLSLARSFLFFHSSLVLLVGSTFAVYLFNKHNSKSKLCAMPKSVIRARNLTFTQISLYGSLDSCQQGKGSAANRHSFRAVNLGLSSLRHDSVSLFIDAITNKRYVYMHTGGRIPQRWIFAIMGFLALFNAYAMRVCLSITITEMVIPMHENTTHFYDNTCPVRNESGKGGNNGTQSYAKRYEWSETMQVKTHTRIRAYVHCLSYV